MPFVSISDLFHHNFLLCLFCHRYFWFFFQFFSSQFKSLSSFASHDIFDSIQMHLWWDFNSMTFVTVGSLKECHKNDNQNMSEFHLWWFFVILKSFFGLSTVVYLEENRIRAKNSFFPTEKRFSVDSTRFLHNQTRSKIKNLRGFGFHLQISGWKLFLNWFDLRNEDLASKVMENS